MIELRGGAQKPLRNLWYLPRIAPPEGAHIVARFIVPFAKWPRKASHLIAAFADIPWLSDKFNF